MKRFVLIHLAGACIALGVAATAQTTDVYVDAVNGSDATGNGSAAAPWKTITHANSVATQKALIHVLPGVYDAALGESYPITLKWPDVAGIVGVDAATCILDGGLTASQLLRVRMVDFDRNAWLAADLTLRNAKAGLVPEPFSWVIGELRAERVVFERIGVSSPLGNGPALLAYAYTNSQWIVEALDCTFSRCAIGLAANGIGSSISASANSCRFEDCDVGAQASAATGGGSAGASVRLEGCRIARCGVGVSTAASADLPSGGASAGADVRQSLLVGCGRALVGNASSSLYLEDSTVSGNQKGIDAPWALVTSSIVRGNAVFDYASTVYATYSNTSPLAAGTGNVDVDPQFANPALGDFHLLAGSPMVDAGHPLAIGGSDGDLDPLTLDGDADGVAQRDIGFDELGLVRVATTTTPQVGGTLGFSVQAPASWTWVLAFATATGDVSFGNWGGLLLDPNALAVVAFGAAPGAPSFAVPNDPALHGAEFHAQAFGWQSLPAPASFGNRVDLVIP
ncbi:MAG: DUF1565 domain-containing protein [Planctomycetota bacterium]|nr:MAG: DUF1565 domain-containing protein [Planctomycetota bacterium]